MTRFTKNLDRLPKVIRDHVHREKYKYNLPSFPISRYIPTQERKTQLEQVRITGGDFVYINKGEHKGQITSVVSYNDQSASFVTYDIKEKRIIPRTNWLENQPSHLLELPVEIPEEDVKLVAKDRDEKGNVSYVVADDVVLKELYFDERYKKWMPRRYVKHHENIEIPWPKPSEDYKKSDVTALESIAHARTYELQTIGKPPIPSHILSQLRNPFSQYKKKTLTDIEARRLNAPEMPLTFEQRIYLAKKAQRPKTKLKPLSEEVKDFIGQKMAKHLGGIQDPHMLAHLDHLSSLKNKDFEQTLERIKKDQEEEGQPQQHTQDSAPQ